MNTRSLLLSAALLLTASSASALQTLGWGNSEGDTALLTSTGSVLDSTFVFELGTFDNIGGFVPTAVNTASWAAHWKLLDRSIAPLDINNRGWNPAIQVFTNTLDFNVNGTVVGLAGSSTFTAGEQAYLWVYNPAGEWALVTDTSPDLVLEGDGIWQLPNPAITNGIPTTWDLFTADTAIVGNLNGSFNTTDFRLQTANVSVIPEPGSSLMVLLVGCLARVMRSRQRI